MADTSTLYRLVQQPDGTMMVVDSVTGQPVYNQDSGTVMGYTPETAPPSPQTTQPGYLGIPGYAAPTATAPANIGPYGLPPDPLGNGPTVPGGTPQSAGATPVADDGYSGGGYSNGGYSGGGYSRGGYSRNYGGGYSSGYGGGYSHQQYGGGGYDDQQVPRYGNNAVHPFFGGEPPVPGGQWAQQDNGYDNRQQVTATSGATAGPFAVKAAPPPESRMYGGGGYSGGGGGGGGITKDIYWHFANKIKDRMTGASGSYGDYAPTRYHPYRGPDDPRVQRRIEQMNPRLNGYYGRMWGDAGQAQGLYDTPLGMLREVAPNLSTNSILYNRMENLPMQQIALLAGAGTRGWQGGLDSTGDIYESYYKKNSKKLSHGGQGMDFLPYYRKQLRKDTSLTDYTNTLGGIYDRMTQGQSLNSDALMQNLVDPARKTWVAQQFRHQPGGTAGKAFMDAYGAVLDVGPYGDIQKQILAKRAQDAITQYQSQFSHRPVKKAPALNQYVGQQLQPWM